jgi:acyl-CoA thioester hydrolase
MGTFEIHYRVSYSDTDQMGFMHHSNYLKCYETARWELFRHLGIPYAAIEEAGFIFPVTEAKLRFIRPLKYDQEVVITTRVMGVSGARILFGYQMTDEDGEIFNEAEVKVGCAGKTTGKALPLPKQVREILSIIENGSSILRK